MFSMHVDGIEKLLLLALAILACFALQQMGAFKKAMAPCNDAFFGLHGTCCGSCDWHTFWPVGTPVPNCSHCHAALSLGRADAS